MVTKEKKVDLPTRFARNLEIAMKDGGFSQSSLARAARVPQTTISLYLKPEKRAATASGKLSGPTMAHIMKLAVALEVDPWQLLHPDIEQAKREHEMYLQIEAAYKKLPPKDE